MTDNKNFLDDKDVVSILSYPFNFERTMKIEEIKKIMNEWAAEKFRQGLFPEFIKNCEVLKQDGKGWKKGQVKIKFEFIPDQSKPEEETEITQNQSLDEFRH